MHIVGFEISRPQTHAIPRIQAYEKCHPYDTQRQSRKDAPIHTIDSKRKVVRLNGESLNTLFEELADWNHQLEHCEGMEEALVALDSEADRADDFEAVVDIDSDASCEAAEPSP